MTRNLIVTGLVAIIIAAFVLTTRFLTGSVAPPVDGYMEGQSIRFIHTEASDQKVADLLTKMKGSPVLVVPSLAQASDEMLAEVYVFKNGIKGAGPFDFQPDVFDSPPGTSGYRPLRRLNLLTWTNARAARELKAAAQVKEAIAKGEITVERPGVVINMPMLTWPGGHR
jgi:hypothetical protein